MTTSVSAILDITGARLETIRKANGHPVTVTRIERGRMTPWQPGDLPACNYWITGVSNERITYRQDRREITLFVELHTRTRDQNLVDAANDLAACVVIALHRDTTAPRVSDPVDRNLNGAVTSLFFAGYDLEIGQGAKPWYGSLVKFDIAYQCDAADMEGFRA